MTAKEKVLAVYPDAFLTEGDTFVWAILSEEGEFAQRLGESNTQEGAWIASAHRLPTPVEPKAQVESASVEMSPKEGEKKDLLNMEKINSLPHPLFIRLAGDKEFSWALEYVDVETGLLKFDVCGLLQSGHIRDVAEFKDANGTVHDAETFYSDYEPAKVEARGLPPLQEGWTNADYFEFLTAIDAEEAYEAYGLNISDSVIEYVARKESTVRQRTDQLKASLLCEKRLRDLLEEIEGEVDDRMDIDNEGRPNWAMVIRYKIAAVTGE